MVRGPQFEKRWSKVFVLFFSCYGLSLWPEPIIIFTSGTVDPTRWNFGMTPWVSDQRIARPVPQEYSTYREARL